MARPRAFDEEEALHQAMQVFWRKGFEATSLSDLTEATGLSRSSLYAAFGDKDGLFARALDKYMEEISAGRVKILRNATSVRQGLRDFFAHHISVALDPRTPAGCMFVNTALEVDAVAPATGERMTARAKDARAAVRQLLERGRANGEISSSTDTQGMASMLVAVSYGLHVMARLHASRRELQGAADSALEALG